MTEPQVITAMEVAKLDERRAISMPLYKILDELMELVALAEEPELAPDEREAVANRVAEYISAEVVGRKVDGIAFTLRECLRRAEIATAEAKRIAARAQAWENRAERIKASTLRAMRAHNIRVLESPTNRLRAQKNGGKEPLDVYAPDEVPDDLKRFTVTLTGEQYARLRALVVEAEEVDFGILLEVLRDARGEPDTDRIRAELGMREVCPECEGVLDVNVTKGCERCENLGHVPVEVPGARILPRGQHLRCE